MKIKICMGKASTQYHTGYRHIEQLGYYETVNNRHAFKRIRMKCELCGRKVLSSIYNDGDGEIYHRIPPHKMKHWWKRGWKKGQKKK